MPRPSSAWAGFSSVDDLGLGSVKDYEIRKTSSIDRPAVLPDFARPRRSAPLQDLQADRCPQLYGLRRRARAAAHQRRHPFPPHERTGDGRTYPDRPPGQVRQSHRAARCLAGLPEPPRRNLGFVDLNPSLSRNHQLDGHQNVERIADRTERNHG